MTFLTPLGALAMLAVLLPFGAWIVGRRRAAAVAAALGLQPPAGRNALQIGAVAAAIALLGLAAAQPALTHQPGARVRTDAEALFVFDTSRSMAASATPASPTRLDRAVAASERLRGAIADVPSGVATLTDRVLPDLLPVADVSSFDTVAGRGVAIESPPPAASDVRATTFAALGDIAAGNYFHAKTTTRLVVLLTDGESSPVNTSQLADALPRTRGYRFIAIRFWHDGESVYRATGKPETAYRPDPLGRIVLADVASALGGRAFDETQLGAAASYVRHAAGSGPTTDAQPATRHRTPLAPYLAALALLLLTGATLERHVIARNLSRALAIVAGVFVFGTILSSAAANGKDSLANVGWGGFGNTPNELRHSPLTQITPGNVDQLGRLFTVDFQKLDPSIRRGQQSYPVEKNGTLYVTTNDDNVFALDATNGNVKWRWTPDDVGVFRNFGIVANRGVAVCDGHVFIMTLDMTIAQIDAATGKLERRVPIAKLVAGASANAGYSETSAPICANHRLIFGAAGSEYGVRGFVMAARSSDLSPAWPNPFWNIPPNGTEWRHGSTLAGGGVVWTPTTVDTGTNTIYFGTGSATPLYFPSIRPGNNPRADSLIAVNLVTGRMKWWQQQMGFNEWSYDTAQPPLVYTGRVGGKAQKIVSVGTMEGYWFAYNAGNGRPIYQRIKVIDRVEHPRLQGGKSVVVYPSSLGGLNFSPAAYDARTNYIFNAAAETAAIDVQSVLTPTQKKRKFTLGDVFLGLQNGNFGTELPGWHDHGSISAIDVGTGRQVWKFTTPEPERGGVSTTESGIGFAGGGDGVLRAFNLANGNVLWTFQTGHQIAAGPAIYSVDGKEYVAITVGGSPTSSNGGLGSALQVFALGGSQTQSPHPSLVTRTLQGVAARPARSKPAARRAAAHGTGRIVAQSAVTVRPWDANSSNVASVSGRVLWNGHPVAGAHVKVDEYFVPAGTAKDGSFHFDTDVTLPARRVVRVSSLRGATIGGKPLSPGQQSAVLGAHGGVSVGYAITGLHARVSGGNVVITGRVVGSAKQVPPLVRLLTYQLSGTVTNAAGNPVQGAVVITRTQDRDFWTHSSATDANGHYTSYFAASDETSADPVSLSVGVALGNTSYGGAVGVNKEFARLKSATMNIQLGNGTAYTVQTPTSFTGAVYTGLVVGVTAGSKVIKPISATWPSANGSFSMTLPGSARGKVLTFWENQRQAFSSFAARPGGRIDLAAWPVQLGDAVPTGLATLKVKR